MPSTDQQPYDDQLLIRHLLGLLSDEEEAHLDELGIVDDEFAWRLKAVENDLVDLYVAGGLSGETLDRFRSVYLSSPAHRAKVSFAESLQTAGARAQPAAAVTAITQDAAAPRARRWLPFSGGPITWGLACAAAIELVVAGGLAWQVTTLRRRLSMAETERAQLAQEMNILHNQVEAQAQVPPIESERLMASLVLPAQARGIGALPKVALTAETSRLQLELELEADDFPAYTVVLTDLTSKQAVQRVDGLKAQPHGTNRVLRFSVEAASLPEGNYIAQVNGQARGREPEPLAGYTFRVTRTGKP